MAPYKCRTYNGKTITYVENKVYLRIKYSLPVKAT